MHPCRYCDAPVRTPRAVQCGAPDCQRRFNTDRQRTYLRDVKERTGVRYEDRYKVQRSCVTCGMAFRTRHGAERCPDCACRDQRKVAAAASASASRDRAETRRRARAQVVLAGSIRRAETLRFQRAADRLSEAAAGTRSRKSIFVAGQCLRCGEPFVCMLTNTAAVYCSRSCARLDAKNARRSKERSGRVRYRRHAIFERDRWTCQLCGKRTKRTAKVPDPKAPVIDHIVPLAAGPDVGGVDAPWNVQCAHFLCNSIKSDSLAQPALALEVA